MYSDEESNDNLDGKNVLCSFRREFERLFQTGMKVKSDVTKATARISNENYICENDQTNSYVQYLEIL
jgi:hypothetical protein